MVFWFLASKTACAFAFVTSSKRRRPLLLHPPSQHTTIRRRHHDRITPTVSVHVTTSLVLASRRQKPQHNLCVSQASLPHHHHHTPLLFACPHPNHGKSSRSNRCVIRQNNSAHARQRARAARTHRRPTTPRHSQRHVVRDTCSWASGCRTHMIRSPDSSTLAASSAFATAARGNAVIAIH